MPAERETLEPRFGAFSDLLPALVGESSVGLVTLASSLVAYIVLNKINLLCRPPRRPRITNITQTHKETVVRAVGLGDEVGSTSYFQLRDGRKSRRAVAFKDLRYLECCLSCC